MARSDVPTFEAPPSEPEDAPGQLIVRVHPEAIHEHLPSPAIALTREDAQLLPEAVAKPFEYLRESAGLGHVEPLFSPRRHEVASATRFLAERDRLAVLTSVADSPSEELEGFSVISLPESQRTPDLVKRIRSSRAVQLVEPMPARWLLAKQADPLRNLQWGMRAIKWFDKTLPDASGVAVGVLDTGIDEKHPDLAGVVATYDTGPYGKEDLVGHGTHVAGTIAAAPNNDAGVAGVARCRLAVWKIFPDTPAPDRQFYVDGVTYLRALQALEGSGVKVANLSIGGRANSLTEELLFRRLSDAGITVVAAMGNEFLRGNPASYPAAYTSVFSVGSIAETLERSAFSNTGQHIDLVAPGSNILSTLPRRRSDYRDESRYASWSGTSMATPHAAGAAALLVARRPSWTSDQVKERLRTSAARIRAMGSNEWTREYGAGLLDVRKAVL
jgi:subtilisin family serine protease